MWITHAVWHLILYLQKNGKILFSQGNAWLKTMLYNICLYWHLKFICYQAEKLKDMLVASLTSQLPYDYLDGSGLSII